MKTPGKHSSRLAGVEKQTKNPVGMSEAIGKIHSMQKKGIFKIKMLTR